MMKAHGGRGGMLAREPGAVIDTSQTKAGPKDPKLARHFQRQCKLHFFLVLFTITKMF